MKDSKRIQWIDVLRGIGIIIMVMGHVGFGGKFDRWIHSYHMPLFFIVSGFLYDGQAKNLKQFIYRKFRTLLVPYVFFIFINYFAWLILEQDSSLLLPLLAALTYNTHGLPIAGACWFLTAMFFTEIIYCVLQKTLHDPRVLCGAAMALAIGISYVETTLGFILPLAFLQGLVGVGFLQIGRLFGLLLKNESVKEPSEVCMGFRIVFGVALLAFNVVLSFVNGYVNVKDGSYSNILLFWGNAVIGTVAIALLAIAIEKNFHRLRAILIKIGQYSIVFLGLNQLIIRLFYRTGLPYVGETGQLSISRLVGSIVITIGTLEVLLLISRLLMSGKLKVIFGK